MKKVILPESVASLIKTILDEVQALDSHQMDPNRRRQLYQAFSTASEISIKITPRWLAVISSLRVLPLFEHKYPNDSSPRELLNLAIAVLQGKATNTEVDEKLDLGHDISGNAWGYNEKEIPWPIWLAANSTYHALVEANGYQPLDHLPAYYKNGILTAWTDDKLCELAGDTAAVAAMSSAYDLNGTTILVDKLLAFWKWWLGEAIVESISAAKHGYLQIN